MHDYKLAYENLRGGGELVAPIAIDTDNDDEEDNT